MFENLLHNTQPVDQKPYADLIFKISATENTLVEMGELGDGFDIEYSINGGDFSPAPNDLTIRPGDHTLELKFNVTTGTSVNMQTFARVLDEVTYWDSFPMSSIVFRNCTKLTSVPETLPEAITNTSYMFYYCWLFNSDITKWDMSRVTNMMNMFQDAQVFNQPIGVWNTANVTNMLGMLYNAKRFNQTINTLITSNVTNMGYMLFGCEDFDQPLNGLDTAKVTNMESMLSNCINFDSSVEGLLKGNVTNAQNMFNNCVKFNQEVNSFITAKLQYAQGMFNGCTLFNKTIVNWSVETIRNILNMFRNCVSYNQDLSTMRFNYSLETTSYAEGATAWGSGNRPKFNGYYF